MSITQKNKTKGIIPVLNDNKIVVSDYFIEEIKNFKNK